MKLVQDIIAMEGQKTFAKGTPFESVVISEHIKHNGALLSDILARFGKYGPTPAQKEMFIERRTNYR
jgi:hypothetical protein